MRITFVRRLWQGVFLFLFFFLVFHTAAGATRLLSLSVSGSIFLEMDPLVALGSLLSTGALYHALGWGLLTAVVIFLLTVLFGRVFCSWICPFGATHHFIGWLFRPRKTPELIRRNAYSPRSTFKYIVFAVFCGAAFFGSLQVGLLDPISLYHRSLTTSLLPVVELVLRAVMPDGFTWLYDADIPFHVFGWVIGFAVLVLFLANLVVPRFFCRYLCPLGAFLGLISRFSLFRIVRDEEKCTNCGLCRRHCEGACDPDKKLRRSECVVCFNCIEDCPHGALSYRFLPSERTAVPWPQFRARRAALGMLAGAMFAPFARLSGRTSVNFSKDVIRPPGSLPEREFLKRCIKCGQCIKVCPTNVLQPALLEAGIEGMWTPVLNMRFGACDKDCTLCSQVCPTGAIQRLLPAERNGTEPYPGREKPVLVKLGTAFYDRGRCLPWAMDRPCVVCEEVCPVSPKAIQTEEVIVTRSDNTKVTLKRPKIDPARCIGCGSCEHACVVKDLPAVRVTAVGESRSRGWGEDDRSLLLNS